MGWFTPSPNGPPNAPAWVRWSALLIRRLPAGRYRLLNRLGRRAHPPFLMRMPSEMGGYSFLCDLRDSIAREVCFTGQYEPQETALVRACLRPGMTFVDVGANWGYFTLLAAHLVGETGRVLSLEPDPRQFQVLTGNIQRNRLRQVAPLAVAAAAGSASLALMSYNDQTDNWGLSRVVADEAGAGTHRVTARALDDVVDELGIRSVDLLKMDIEGFEEAALRGMERGLAEHVYRRLLLEVHPTLLAERGIPVSRVFNRLEVAGYQGWRIDHSPAATRLAAYGTGQGIEKFLRPIDPVAASDAWPHYLWVNPAGADPVPTCRYYPGR